MRILFILAALAPAAAAPVVPGFIHEAIERTLEVPNAKVVILRYQPTLAADCVPISATAVAPPGFGGQITLRIAGMTARQVPCEGWARVQASISIPVLVTTKALAAGAPLSDAVVLAERPWGEARHPVRELPAGALSTESLAAGTALEERYVRPPGPTIGDEVTVVVETGAVVVSQNGRLTSCSKGHECATLPSGRRVEGHLLGEELHVEAQ